MPIYEYTCPKCHETFEEWVRNIDDHDEQPCPKCGSSAHRVISNTSFILKGSGWYVTDYGSHHTPDHNTEHGSDAETGSQPKESGKKEAPSAVPPKTSDTPASASKPSPAQPNTAG